MQYIRIRNYHLDGYGHVNNARYLEFFEEARWACFEQCGLLPLLSDGLMLVVARADVRYRAAAAEGDTLRMETAVKAADPRRLVMVQRAVLHGRGKTAAEAEITLMPVCGGKPVRLDAKLLEALSAQSTAASDGHADGAA